MKIRRERMKARMIRGNMVLVSGPALVVSFGLRMIRLAFWRWVERSKVGGIT